eukprot:763088_1
MHVKEAQPNLTKQKLRLDLAEANSEITNKSERILELERQIETFSNDHKSGIERIKLAIESKSRARIESSEQKLRAAELKLCQVAEERERFAKSSAEIKLKFDTLNAEIRTLEAAKNSAEARLSDKEGQMKLMETKASVAERSHFHAAVELERLRAEIEWAQKQENELKRKCSSTLTDLDSLKRAKRREHTRHSEQLRAMERALEDSLEQFEAKQRQCGSLEERVDSIAERAAQIERAAKIERAPKLAAAAARNRNRSVPAPKASLGSIGDGKMSKNTRRTKKKAARRVYK